MSTLLQPFLVLIHFIYNVYITICSQCALIHRQLISRLVPQGLNLRLNRFSECDTRRIKKLPAHLIIVVGGEDVCFAELARIINWTVTLGIPHVTFYDQDGIIKSNSSMIRKAFEKLRPNLISKVAWDPEETIPKSCTTNGFNGFLTATKVHFLSYKNGKPEIINLTRELSHAVAQGLVKTEEININLLNDKLQLKFPEPDLGIICGGAFSTFGVLPWHIRVTEFFHLSTHHNLSRKDFMNVLVKYGDCEQRYGK